jgi:HEAT repeats
LGEPGKTSRKITAMTILHYAAPSQLEAAFLSGNEDRIVEELRKITNSRTRRHRRSSIVIKILEQTESPRVRNAAALALADMHTTSAGKKLINILRKPETKGYRGTILYALDELGTQLPISLLADLIMNESYEAQQEALAFIVSGKIEYDQDIDDIKRKLSSARKHLTGEQACTLSEAIKYLNNISVNTPIS